MSVYEDMARDAGGTTEEEIKQMAQMIEADHRRQFEEQQGEYGLGDFASEEEYEAWRRGAGEDLMKDEK